jgi:hypothetical protein
MYQLVMDFRDALNSLTASFAVMPNMPLIMNIISVRAAWHINSSALPQRTASTCGKDNKEWPYISVLDATSVICRLCLPRLLK